MKALLYLLSCCWFISLPIQAETFQAPVTDTQWQLAESNTHCALVQSIPDFGQVGFYRDNGKPIQLVFNTSSLPADGSDVLFAVASAPWQNKDDLMPLASQPSEPGQQRFELIGLQAATALTYLQEGHFPLIQYQSNRFHQPINVAMSTVKLNTSLPAFQTCQSKLITDAFTDVAFLTLYFDIEDATLDMASKQALDRLAAYVKADTSVNQIKISSHTDNTGRRGLNEALSAARADVVKTYLLTQNGLPAEKINSQSFRDIKPVSDNKTQLGRAHNRRTEIRLIR